MKQMIVFLGLTILTLLITSVALAKAGYVPSALLGTSLSWWTTDGGGGTSVEGSYALRGTIGQADAGTMSGGCNNESKTCRYWLKGGFWSGREKAEAPLRICLPIVVRQ